MGTITAANFQIFQSATWNVDTASEGGAISANQILFDVALTGTMTFSASPSIVGVGTTFTTEIAVGDLLYNSSNDTYTNALRVVSITDNTHLTLASSYAGTTGATKNGNKIPKNSIFPDVTDSLRQTGGYQYRKIFVNNNNVDTVRLKAWLNANYSAPNESIAISVAGTATGTVSSDNVLSSGVNGSAWRTPTSIADSNVQDLGSLANGGSAWIWLKRTVTAGGNGYINDQFVIGIGMY